MNKERFGFLLKPIQRVLYLYRYLYRYFLNKSKGYSDYFSFPFDFNQPMPPNAEVVMKECCEALERLQVKYYITDGTALGLYRNGTFIPHDNDIDVDIIGVDDVQKIHECFTKTLGMNLGRRLVYKDKVQQLIYYTNDYIIFDMVFWQADKDDYFNYIPESPYPRKQNKKYFVNSDKINFLGKEYPLHSPVVEWLEMRYGHDWMIPKTAKGDWKEDCHDFDIK